MEMIGTVVVHIIMICAITFVMLLSVKKAEQFEAAESAE